MSTAKQTTSPSTNGFTKIFDDAKKEYERITGKSLDTHPFAKTLRSCDNAEAVLNVFQTQADVFSKSCEGDKKLIALLDPTIRILSAFSDTLGDVIGQLFPPTKIVFTGIGALLTAARGVMADNETLIDLFGRIQSFLQRLETYIKMPLTNGFTELLGKIMAQTLHILAHSTKAMTKGRTEKLLKKLIGGTDVDDALDRLDKLTKEESLMTAAENLKITHRIEGKVEEIKGVTLSIKRAVKVLNERTYELQWNQLQENLRSWLSPPDPSTNQNSACDIRHGETTTWFIQGSTYKAWKENGSLLWIRGNPGAGKGILSSAVIEDIKKMREDRSALVAYYFFDFKDASKRHVRGLLASLLFQLCDDSDRCRDILHQLFNTCRKGSEQPRDADLAKCLKTILELPGQLPIFITIDALDECPSTTDTPPPRNPREEALYFVEDLVKSNCSNLFICVTSRPEQDISTALDHLTSPSCRVSLHEEGGQREDINKYIHSFVTTDRAMRRWREEDKKHAIKVLSERAGGMFRWVYCQLDTLRRCFPSSIPKTLDELPTTLDETYERTLKGIPNEKKQHAHRLFQCLVAAVRPLRVEELAEIFAINFDQDAVHGFMKGWRPEHPEEDILSACSTLITVIDNKDTKVVQFSHFSVKEFLISKRLLTSHVGNIHDYHISLDAAHTILAQGCLTVLLQLDEKTDKKRLQTFPLAFYAAQYWHHHTKYEDATLRVQDAMERLFDSSKSHLAAWLWIYDVVQPEFRPSIDSLTDQPSCPKESLLYYALFCGQIGLCKYLIATHGTDVNAEYSTYASLLHAILAKGNLDAISLLLDLGADVNMKNEHKRTPLCEAYRSHGHHRRLEVMRLLLERGAAPGVWYDDRDLLLHKALYMGEAEVIRLLLQHNADANAPIHSNHTPLHWASSIGNTNIAQILLEYGANINALSDFGTPLFHASLNGHLQVAQLLLARGADVHIRALGRPTPFHVATEWGMTLLKDLLSKHGAEDIGGDVASAEDDTIHAEQNQGLAASTDSRVAAHRKHP